MGIEGCVAHFVPASFLITKFLVVVRKPLLIFDATAGRSGSG